MRFVSIQASISHVTAKRAEQAASTGPGRRRSQRAHRAVLTAAAQLLERDGWHALTIEAIAKQARVSKATIYRWWPSKAAVLMDALLFASHELADFPDTGDAVDDITLQLRSIIHLFTQTPAGRGLLTLIAESQHDPQLAAALSDRLISHRRSAAIAVLQRGQHRGNLRCDLDPAIATDAIYGAIYYRLLVSHELTTPDYADTLIAQLEPALR